MSRTDDNKLKGFEDFRFDGKRKFYFMRDTGNHIINALGNKHRAGDSLKNLYNNEDIGNPNHPNVPGGGWLAPQTQGHNERQQWLQVITLGMISPNISLFNTINTRYTNHGREAMVLLMAEADKPLPLSLVVKMNNSWMNATMELVGIGINYECALVWFEWVFDKAQRFNPIKTWVEIHTKFLDGLPGTLQSSIVLPERRNPNRIVFPAVYPAGDPQAAQAHPNAGQPDVRRLAIEMQDDIDRLIDNKVLAVRKNSTPHSALAVFPGVDDVEGSSSDNQGSDEIYFVRNSKRISPTDKTR